MARVTNEEEYAGRRSHILDTAQRLVYTKGFRQMTIQDVLDELGISKGAFYHYFDSKQALLEGLVARMIEALVALAGSIANDPALGPLEKLERFFSSISGWKMERKSFLQALFQSWYSDDNAVVRQKVQAASLEAVGPLLTGIIREGARAGVLRPPYPDQAAGLFFALSQGLGDALGAVLLSPELDRYDWERIEGTVAAYTEALEHVLGAPAGSLNLLYMDVLKEWAGSDGEKA